MDLLFYTEKSGIQKLNIIRTFILFWKPYRELLIASYQQFLLKREKKPVKVLIFMALWHQKPIKIITQMKFSRENDTGEGIQNSFHPRRQTEKLKNL